MTDNPDVPVTAEGVDPALVKLVTRRKEASERFVKVAVKGPSDPRYKGAVHEVRESNAALSAYHTRTGDTHE